MLFRYIRSSRQNFTESWQITLKNNFNAPTNGYRMVIKLFSAHNSNKTNSKYTFFSTKKSFFKRSVIVKPFSTVQVLLIYFFQKRKCSAKNTISKSCHTSGRIILTKIIYLVNKFTILAFRSNNTVF